MIYGLVAAGINKQLMLAAAPPNATLHSLNYRENSSKQAFWCSVASSVCESVACSFGGTYDYVDRLLKWL